MAVSKGVCPALASLLLVLMALTPITAQPANSPPDETRVILFLWDGTQRSHFLELYDTGLLPNLRVLVENGGLLRTDLAIHSETCLPGSGDGYLTQTGPANSAILTGYGYPDQGNQSNVDPHPIPEGYTFYERLQAANADTQTGVVCGKAEEYWPTIPLANAAPTVSYWFQGEAPPETLTEYADDFLTQYAGSSFFLYVHYAEPDTAGHAFGENSPEYTQALVADDRELGQVMSYLSQLGIRDLTRVLVTTDHGFLEGGHNHNVCNDDDRNVWIAADQAVLISKLGIDTYQTSLTPTLFDIFGLDKNVEPRFPAQSLYDDGKPPIPVLQPIDNPEREGTYWIEWSAVPEADMYTVDESGSPDFAGAVSLYFGPDLGYEVANRPFGRWYYRVLAFNGAGGSPWSDTESTEVWARLYLPAVQRER
jgi:hypothetical protein